MSLCSAESRGQNLDNVTWELMNLWFDADNLKYRILDFRPSSRCYCETCNLINKKKYFHVFFLKFRILLIKKRIYQKNFFIISKNGELTVKYKSECIKEHYLISFCLKMKILLSQIFKD